MPLKSSRKSYVVGRKGEGALQSQAYRQLLSTLQSTLGEARHAIERTAVSMYWTIGRAIEVYLKSAEGRALPNGAFYRRLSRDLQVDYRTLYQTNRFYRTYPKLDSSLPLSWSHYRYLTQIKNDAQRARWEKRIVRENLGVHAFQALLQEARTEKGGPAQQLMVQRGQVFHYRLVSVNDAHSSQPVLMLDCGFDNRIVPPAHTGQIINKYIYRSDRDETGYALKVTKATVGQVYTYPARVERVVDGDTLVVQIDCGFGLFHREKLRLRGIDTPEVKTIAGKRAKAFVEEELAKCAFIVLKSYKEDKYGRYLADIFMLPNENNPQRIADQGEPLNQKLFDAGLARVYNNNNRGQRPIIPGRPPKEKK